MYSMMELSTTPNLHSSEDKQEQAALLVVALAVLGEKKRQEKRRKRRNYLRRRDLHALPRMQSAWQQLYITRSEKAYVLTTGLDPCTLEWLLERFDPLWSSTPVERNDLNFNAVPRTAARSLDSGRAWPRASLPEFYCAMLHVTAGFRCSAVGVYALFGVQHGNFGTLVADAS